MQGVSAFSDLLVSRRRLSKHPSRLPFSHEVADIVSVIKPRVVSFHFGLPAPDLLQRVRSYGAKVLSSATTVDEARWLEAHGVDAVIARGLEARGHWGTFFLTISPRRLARSRSCRTS